MLDDALDRLPEKYRAPVVLCYLEGLSNADRLSPLQQAFRKHHALQCGFCTPGMLTTLHALLTDEPEADADRIRDVLSARSIRCPSRQKCQPSL